MDASQEENYAGAVDNLLLILLLSNLDYEDAQIDISGTIILNLVEHASFEATERSTSEMSKDTGKLYSTYQKSGCRTGENSYIDQSPEASRTDRRPISWRAQEYHDSVWPIEDEYREDDF